MEKIEKLHCWTVSRDDVLKIIELMRIDEKVSDKEINRIMRRFKSKVEWVLGEDWIRMIRESIREELGIIRWEYKMRKFIYKIAITYLIFILICVGLMVLL